MREPADGWLERDAVDLHFLEWRPDGVADGPAVLLLHGLSSNAHYWDRLAAQLGNRRLVALDQRGHGLTARAPRVPPIPEGFAMQELLDDVAYAADRLELDKPVIAGHSWGATVALEVVAQQPAVASALVFVDGPVQSAANLFTWEEAQHFMQPPLPRYSLLSQAVDDARRDFEGAWGDDLEPFVMSRLMQEGNSFILTLTGPIRLELLKCLYDSPVDSLWAQLAVPATALLARGGPGLIAGWKLAGAKRVEEVAPDVQVKWFDTPHDIPLFAPKDVAAEVERMATTAGSLRSETAAGQNLQS